MIRLSRPRIGLSRGRDIMTVWGDVSVKGWDKVPRPRATTHRELKFMIICRKLGASAGKRLDSIILSAIIEGRLNENPS